MPRREGGHRQGGPGRRGGQPGVRHTAGPRGARKHRPPAPPSPTPCPYSPLAGATAPGAGAGAGRGRGRAPARPAHGLPPRRVRLGLRAPGAGGRDSAGSALAPPRSAPRLSVNPRRPVIGQTPPHRDLLWLAEQSIRQEPQQSGASWSDREGSAAAWVLRTTSDA